MSATLHALDDHVDVVARVRDDRIIQRPPDSLVNNESGPRRHLTLNITDDALLQSSTIGTRP